MPASNALKIAQLSREKFFHMRLKAGQRKWQYERALKLADEFDSMANEKTRIAFWSRDNVVRAIEKGNAKDMMYWLDSKIWLLEQGLAPDGAQHFADTAGGRSARKEN